MGSRSSSLMAAGTIVAGKRHNGVVSATIDGFRSLSATRRFWTLTIALATSLTLLALTIFNTTSSISANFSSQGLHIDPGHPGSVVEISALASVNPEIRAVSTTSVRIVYRSTDATSGELVDVSGAFFLPAGRAPAGGWPVVAVAHQGEGIDEPCAPS